MPMATSHVTNTVDTNSRRGGYFVSGVRKGLYFTGGNREMATGKSGGRRGGGNRHQPDAQTDAAGWRAKQANRNKCLATINKATPPLPPSLPFYLACRER